MTFFSLLAQINIPSNNDYFNDPSTLPSRLANKLLMYGIVVAGLFFFVRLLLAGFSLLSSFGDPGKIQTAQQQLLNAFIGLVLVVSTFFIAEILSQILGVNILG